MIERKTFSLKLDNSEPEEGVIKGYASTFGNVDLGQDVVKKGAFTKTLKEQNGGKGIVILKDHDPYSPIGYNRKASEDNSGLAVEGVLNLAIQDAKERWALIKQAIEMETNMGLSIGYQTVKYAIDKANGMIRELQELKLFEYSVVVFPMNVEAMVTAAKSLGQLERVHYILKTLEEQGISKSDFEQALLKKEADRVNYNPTLISQSLDTLIKTLKQ